jgi:hypothetical protein
LRNPAINVLDTHLLGWYSSKNAPSADIFATHKAILE